MQKAAILASLARQNYAMLVPALPHRSSGKFRLTTFDLLEQLIRTASASGLNKPEVTIRRHRRDSAARSSLQQSLLDQIRLDDVFQGVAFFAHRRGQIVDADRASRKLFYDCEQQLSIHDV